jgi:hypothetical protein
VVLYEPGTIYARRITTSPADKRLWARLELDRLPDVKDLPSLRNLVELTGSGNVAVTSPVFLAELLSGVLTGSVRVRETDADGNRRITCNTSIAKAQREHHADDKAKDATKRLLRTLAIKDDIHGLEVVLRRDGTLGRVTFRLDERPDKLTRIALEATMTFGSAAAPDAGVDLAAPPRGSTVRVPSLSVLESTVSDQLSPRGAPRLPPTPGIDVVGTRP